MSYLDYIVIGVIAAAITLAIIKLVRNKRKGIKCSGCEGCTKDCAERK